MKNYSYEIKFNYAGVVTSEFEYSKLLAIKNYIDKLTLRGVCGLKILRNGTDITEQVNKFLYK